MTHFASRLAGIEPFQVMDILARARALEAQGRSIMHMEIGEPDFPAAPGIVEAGIAALKAGHTHYTPALGLPALRAAIAANYAPACRVNAARVVVTPGASGALQLVLAALLDPGDQALMADPGYPCNRHFVRLFEGAAVSIAVGPETHYQLNAELIRERWTPRTVAVLLASPSNPTGTLVPPAELARIVATVRELGGVLIVDEIYHGLTYGAEAVSALTYSSDVFVINSFSKYYGMTGWRLGWVVAPDAYVSALDKLAQNIFSRPARRRSTRRWRRSPCRCNRSWKKDARYSANGATICCRRCANWGSIFRSRRKARFIFTPTPHILPTTASGLRANCWSKPAWRSHRAETSVAIARGNMCAFPTPTRAKTWRKGAHRLAEFLRRR